MNFSFNPFSTNVPIMEKPGSWSLPVKCVKIIYGRVTFKLKMQVHGCIFTENVTLPQVFFTHFVSKNHPPDFSIIGTLA